MGINTKSLIGITIIAIFIVLLFLWAWNNNVFIMAGLVKDKSTFGGKARFHGTDGPRGYGIATHYGL